MAYHEQVGLFKTFKHGSILGMSFIRRKKIIRLSPQTLKHHSFLIKHSKIEIYRYFLHIIKIYSSDKMQTKRWAIFDYTKRKKLHGKHSTKRKQTTKIFKILS
jgi:hypothetical protein